MKLRPATRGSDTQAEILAAARTLFIAQGYTATTVRQIATAAGITPAAIYNHFPGKAEVFTALLLSLAPYDQLLDILDKLEADSAESLVRQIFQCMLPFLAEHEDYVRMAMIDAQERDGAALATLMPAVLPHAYQFYQRLVALDGADGRMQRLLFPVFARSLLSLLAGFMMTESIVKKAAVLQMPDIDWPSALSDIFLNGMLAAPRPD